MDLLIKKGDVPQRLSELGVIVTDISRGTPSLDIQTQSVAFKNGKKFQNATHSEKAITVTGYYYAAGIEADLRMQDKLNGVFGSLEPYFIAEMIEERQDMYGYERPGESQNPIMQQLSNDGVQDQMVTYVDYNHSAYKYGFIVLLSDVIDYEAQGKVGDRILTKVTLSFVTTGVPYGITEPVDIDLTGQTSIPYAGTTGVSQFDWPFYFELTASEAQGYTFDFTVGKQKFTYTAKGKVTIKKGGVFLLNGISFKLNQANINDQTNIQEFELLPSDTLQVPFQTTFKGDVIIKNKVDFYI